MFRRDEIDSQGLVTVFDTVTGKPMKVWPVDGREMVKEGTASKEPPYRTREEQGAPPEDPNSSAEPTGEPIPPSDSDGLEDLKLPELRKLAIDLDVGGAPSMKTKDLISAIRSARAGK